MTSEFKAAVFAYLAGETEAVPAGTLTILEEGRRVLSSRFGYGAKYLARPKAVPVDSGNLRLEGAVPGSEALLEPTQGLEFFGAIRDAMPDLWGRRVIENRLRVPPDSLPETRYLMEAGSNRFGALDIRRDLRSQESDGRLVPASDLRYLLEAADRILSGDPVPASLAQLFDAGPSMGGARPKAVVVRGDKQFLAKFPADRDGFDVPAIERATLELARRCGLSVPETDLIRLPDGRSVMLIERFDRQAWGDGFARRHAISALTVLDRHESESAQASYADLALKLSDIGAAGRVQQDRSELFGRMVFNILVSNDDDHLRNHAVVWQPQASGWGLSPLYDVLPKPQIGETRYLHLGVGKQGRLASLPNALSQAALFGLNDAQAREIVDRISLHVREWRVYFDEFGIASRDMDIVATAIRHPRHVGWR